MHERLRAESGLAVLAEHVEEDFRLDVLVRPPAVSVARRMDARVRRCTVEIEAIGIVVPARNEEARLPRCLAALESAAASVRAADDAAPRVRAIVVVDGSTDGTLRIARNGRVSRW